MNFRIFVVSRELVVMPNNVSSVVGEIRHSLTWLNQFKTFWVNNLGNTHSIRECSIESLCPQYSQSSSVLIPNLNNSFLVTIVLSINLNCNFLTNVLQRFKDPSPHAFIQRYFFAPVFRAHLIIGVNTRYRSSLTKPCRD